MKPFIIAPDPWGEPWVWDNSNPGFPEPLLRRGVRCPQDLWQIIADAVESSVSPVSAAVDLPGGGVMDGDKPRPPDLLALRFAAKADGRAEQRAADIATIEALRDANAGLMLYGDWLGVALDALRDGDQTDVRL